MQHDTCVNHVNSIYDNVEAMRDKVHNNVVGLRNHVHNLVIDIEGMAQEVVAYLVAQQQLPAAMGNQINGLVSQVQGNPGENLEEEPEVELEKKLEEEPE